MVRKMHLCFMVENLWSGGRQIAAASHCMAVRQVACLTTCLPACLPARLSKSLVWFLEVLLLRERRLQ